MKATIETEITADQAADAFAAAAQLSGRAEAQRTDAGLVPPITGFAFVIGLLTVAAHEIASGALHWPTAVAALLATPMLPVFASLVVTRLMKRLSAPTNVPLAGVEIGPVRITATPQRLMVDRALRRYKLDWTAIDRVVLKRSHLQVIVGGSLFDVLPSDDRITDAFVAAGLRRERGPWGANISEEAAWSRH